MGEARHDGAIGTGLDELIDPVEVEEPVPHGQSVELTGLIHGLKARRAALGRNRCSEGSADRRRRE